MNILEQNKEKINGKLATFDRIIVNGYLKSLINPKTFSYFLYENGIFLKDFKDYAEAQTKELCEHIENYAKQNGCNTKFLTSSKDSKEDIVKEIFQSNPNKEGLIATLSAVEYCKVMTVQYNYQLNTLEVVSRSTKCKHYYLYYNDPVFGWMFIKIQTWFPYNVEIYINAHEYLSKVFDKNNIYYEMFNNSFSYIDDFDKAQDLANKILNKDFTYSFDKLINDINIHLPNIKEKNGDSYYYCINQCEFALDITFKSINDLNIFYKKLTETTYYTFSCEDIYSFFGRNIKDISKFRKGSLTSDLKSWYQGYRIKFRFNKNQIKMYNKGNNLRIEVTINDPKDFKILKTVEDDESGEVKNTKKWVPMGKCIINLYRYAEVSKSIINRFIDALPEIDIEDKVPIDNIQKVSSKNIINNRKYSAFNILNSETTKLFKTISNGKFIGNGFTNKSIRKELFIDSENKYTINKLTRLLAKLRAFGIIKKINKKNKYYLTKDGRNLCSSILIYIGKELVGI